MDSIPVAVMPRVGPGIAIDRLEIEESPLTHLVDAESDNDFLL